MLIEAPQYFPVACNTLFPACLMHDHAGRARSALNPTRANLCTRFTKLSMNHRVITWYTYSFCILEGVEVLCKVSGRGAEAGDHGRAGVPPQRALQEPCDLRLPVGDMGGPPPWIPKGTDDVAQG